MSARFFLAVLAAALAAAAPLARGQGQGDAPAPQAAPATAADEGLEDARIAWRYFERNYHPATGFVSSVDGYPSTTMWDLGSTIFATLAARELGLVDAATFEGRIDTLLWTLQMLPLFERELPNKAYDARTGAMADYANKPSKAGIGFSAIDLGRLASALTALAARAPAHRAAVARVLGRWHYCPLLGAGELHGASVDERGKVQRFQEGRLGYEQYAADGLARVGLGLAGARGYGRFEAETSILGVKVPHDTRDRRRYGALDAVVTDPWMLGAFEFGPGGERGDRLRRLFEVQKRRWERTGIVTATGEDHVDAAPWFVYGAIWEDGAPWRTVTPNGEDAARFGGLSTKSAIALAKLFPDDPYAFVLRRAVTRARDPERGWFAGIYEDGRLNRSLNANTNGVILEAELYARAGTLHGTRAAAARATGSLTTLAAFPGGAGVAGRCTPGTAEAERADALVPQTPAAAPAAPRPGRIYANVLTFTAFADYRGIDRGGAGGILTLWPLGATFLRLGGEYTPWSPGGTSRLLWGIGWDDWRPWTPYLRVENWGPVRPQDVKSTHDAELNFGLRGPNACAGALCLSPQLGGTVPRAGGPYVNLRATLTIGGKWFAMGGVGRTVPGVFEGPLGTPRWRFVWGFGRWDWRPGTFYVTYYDWGPTSWSHNGVLAVGVNLAF